MFIVSCLYIPIWLVVYLPLWKMMEWQMTFPTEWKVIQNSMVPKHQPNNIILDVIKQKSIGISATWTTSCHGEPFWFRGGGPWKNPGEPVDPITKHCTKNGQPVTCLFTLGFIQFLIHVNQLCTFQHFQPNDPAWWLHSCTKKHGNENPRFFWRFLWENDLKMGDCRRVNHRILSKIHHTHVTPMSLRREVQATIMGICHAFPRRKVQRGLQVVDRNPTLKTNLRFICRG